MIGTPFARFEARKAADGGCVVITGYVPVYLGMLMSRFFHVRFGDVNLTYKFCLAAASEDVASKVSNFFEWGFNFRRKLVGDGMSLDVALLTAPLASYAYVSAMASQGDVRELVAFLEDARLTDVFADYLSALSSTLVP